MCLLVQNHEAIDMTTVTANHLISLGVLEKTAEAWAPAFAENCERHEINTNLRLAHFFGQIMVESAKLSLLEENLRYSAVGLANTWPNRYGLKRGADGKWLPNALAISLHRRPEAIANNCYANRMGNGDEASGEGWKYRGFGPKQVTGKNNHQEFAAYAGIAFDEYEPALLRHPQLGSLSACWYWFKNNLSMYADDDDPRAVTIGVNGGLNGFEDRKQFTALGIEEVFV
jgi:putative chitinase